MDKFGFIPVYTGHFHGYFPQLQRKQSAKAFAALQPVNEYPTL